MKKVLTMGTFDLFHVGHVDLLLNAKQLGDHLTVGVNTDNFVEFFKRKPIMNFPERLAPVAACKFVDAVYANHGWHFQPELIRFVNPDIIAIGEDWQDRDYLGQIGINEQFLVDNQIKIVYIPHTVKISTTKILERVANA